MKKQADDIASQINQRIDGLIPAIEKAGRDSRFSKATAIISIIIALASAVIAGAALALQVGAIP